MKNTILLKIVTKALLLGLLFSVQNLASQTESFVTSKKSETLSIGITMKYVEFGSENEETIVLIHGYTDTSRSFEKVIQNIQKLNPNVRIICPDLRGHGDSSIPTNHEDYKIEDFSNDILALMAFKNISKVHLVGHSFGSMIAQDMAIKNSEKIESMVLIGTLADASINTAITDFLMNTLIYGEWKDKLVAEFGPEWKQKSYHLTPKDLGEDVLKFLRDNWVVEDRANTAFINSIYQETVNTPLITWFEALKQISQFQNSSQLEHLKVPTLVIWGADDELMPESPDQTRLKSNLKTAYQNHKTPVFYKTYSKSNTNDLKFGHNLHWTIPKEIATDIVNFIGEDAEVKSLNSNTINLGKTETF